MLAPSHHESVAFLSLGTSLGEALAEFLEYPLRPQSDVFYMGINGIIKALDEPDEQILGLFLLGIGKHPEAIGYQSTFEFTKLEFFDKWQILWQQCLCIKVVSPISKP